MQIVRLMLGCSRDLFEITLLRNKRGRSEFFHTDRMKNPLDVNGLIHCMWFMPAVSYMAIL